MSIVKLEEYKTDDQIFQAFVEETNVQIDKILINFGSFRFEDMDSLHDNIKKIFSECFKNGKLIYGELSLEKLENLSTKKKVRILSGEEVRFRRNNISCDAQYIDKGISNRILDLFDFLENFKK